jgi:hypothetical protein
MDEIDDLLNNLDCPIPTPYSDIKDFFDFNASKEAWGWVLVSDLLHRDFIQEPYENSCLILGRKLSRLAKEGCGVRRKHSNKGSLYF